MVLPVTLRMTSRSSITLGLYVSTNDATVSFFRKGDENAVAGAKDLANPFLPPAKPATFTGANKSMHAPGK